MNEVTVCRHEITPRCQEIHGGLAGAMLEAARRAAVAMEECAKHDCNKGAHYHIIVKVERKP